MKDDLVEQCAAAVHFCRDDADAHEIANAVLATARPAILEEAAKVAYRHGQNIDWDDGDGGQFGHGFESACEEISGAIRALAHTTGQEGGR